MNNETTVVWLDTNINKDSEIKIKLKPFISYIKIFDNVDDCLHYIDIHSSITLIIASTLIELIIPSICELPQIKMIYVHNIDNSRNKYDLIKQLSSKIIGIYDHINQLIRNLLDENLFPLLPISIINPKMIKETSIRDLTNEQATFMWFQLLLETLLQMPQTADSLRGPPPTQKSISASCGPIELKFFL